MHDLPTATTAEKQALAARMTSYVANADGTITACFKPTVKLNSKSIDAHRVLLEERGQLARALAKSLGEYRYMHVLGEPANGQLVVECSQHAVAPFQQFHEQYAPEIAAPKTLLGKVGSAILDGITQSACAQYGLVVPGTQRSWGEREVERDLPSDPSASTSKGR